MSGGRGGGRGGGRTHFAHFAHFGRFAHLGRLAGSAARLCVAWRSSRCRSRPRTALRVVCFPARCRGPAWGVRVVKRLTPRRLPTRPMCYGFTASSSTLAPRVQCRSSARLDVKRLTYQRASTSCCAMSCTWSRARHRSSSTIWYSSPSAYLRAGGREGAGSRAFSKGRPRCHEANDTKERPALN